MKRPPTCVYPGCLHTRRTRGLCHGHYQTAQAYRRAGTATDADLVRRGLMLPAGGRNAKLDHSALLLGSTVRGDA